MRGDVSWRYSAGNSVFETGESGSEEVIEEHFKELEHSASNYFGEYRIELADDGLIILEKEYNRRMLSDSILVGKEAEDLKFKVIGEVKEEILEDIWERIRR